MTTDRTDFNETWLAEMPQQIPIVDYYDAMVSNIKDYSQTEQIINLGTFKGFEVRKIKLDTLLFYWFELDNTILLAVELVIKPQGLIVRLLGKNPEYKNKKPYASDLYAFILQDTKNGIRLFSDDRMSNEGFNLWRRLFNDGFKVSTYDNNNPGGTFITLHSFFDFENFFNSDASYKQYQFVLHESTMITETRCQFHTRRIRELSGLNLED